MDSKRQRSFSWADVAAVDAMQRAADTMSIATASIRLQHDGETGVSRSSRPGPDSILSEPRSSRCRVDIAQNQSPLGRIANGRDLLRSRPVSANMPPSSSSTRSSRGHGRRHNSTSNSTQLLDRPDNPFRRPASFAAAASPSRSYVISESSPRQTTDRNPRGSDSTRRRTPPLLPPNPAITWLEQQQQYHIHIHQTSASRRVQPSSQKQHHQPQEPQYLELEHLRPVPPPHVYLPNTTITNVSLDYYDDPSTHLAFQPSTLLHNESSSTIIPPSGPEDSQTSLLSYYFPSAETLPTSSTPCPSTNNKPTLPKKKPVPI